MSFYDTSRDRGEAENLPSICKAVKSLEEATRATYSAEAQIERAFLLGLWYKNFPEYTLEHLEKGYIWNHMELMPKGAGQYADPYKHLLKFSFISNTGDSWHQCYRDFRERGWQRAKVHRDGGRLQYLLELKGEDKPKGFSEIHLILDISISTCKQVQVGTEMKEVPIMKTVCEDLVEIQETETETETEADNHKNSDEAESVKVDSTLEWHAVGCAKRYGAVSDQLCECEKRLQRELKEEDPNSPEYEKAHGPEGQIPSRSEFEDADSGEDTNTEEQKPLSYQDYVHF